MKIFECGSAEYEGYIKTLTDATAIQNRRNRYTKAERNGTANPFGDEVPRKPTHEELKVIDDDRKWKAELKDKSDSWWFKRIDAAIEENFYRAKVSCLIWWDLCRVPNTKRSSDKWHERFKHYDFDKDLFADLDLIEYALHCCGFPPAKARQMVFDAKDRQKWRAQQNGERQVPRNKTLN